MNSAQETFDNTLLGRLGNDIKRLEAENKRLREALEYIAERSWISDNEEQAFRWVNEFVEVAHQALSNEYKAEKGDLQT